MTITSTAFQDNTEIPEKYTCNGGNYNPPFTFSQTPREAQSLALVVEDPDAPNKTWTHWVLYNIPPSTLEILPHSLPENSMSGMTDFGSTEYGGPCPPTGVHRYFFKLFALDTLLDLPEGATKETVESAMKGHVLEAAQIIGLYGKK